jgi:hypothetical protein
VLDSDWLKDEMPGLTQEHERDGKSMQYYHDAIAGLLDSYRPVGVGQNWDVHLRLQHRYLWNCCGKFQVFYTLSSPTYPGSFFEWLSTPSHLSSSAAPSF